MNDTQDDCDYLSIELKLDDDDRATIDWARSSRCRVWEWESHHPRIVDHLQCILRSLSTSLKCFDGVSCLLVSLIKSVWLCVIKNCVYRRGLVNFVLSNLQLVAELYFDCFCFFSPHSSTINRNTIFVFRFCAASSPKEIWKAKTLFKFSSQFVRLTRDVKT